MMELLPFAYGLRFGDQEHYGALDANGYFQETDPRSLPIAIIARFGESDLGLRLPCEAEILDPAGKKPVAILRVGVVRGRIACTEIVAHASEELTGQLLRQVPISSLVREIARSQIVHLRDGFAVRFVADAELPEKRRRRVLDDAFLQQVAGIYRAALAAGLPTQEEIERQLGPVSGGTARRWVMQARKAGFLGPALGRKAGEVHEPSASS